MCRHARTTGVQPKGTISCSPQTSDAQALAVVLTEAAGAEAAIRECGRFVRVPFHLRSDHNMVVNYGMRTLGASFGRSIAEFRSTFRGYCPELAHIQRTQGLWYFLEAY